MERDCCGLVKLLRAFICAMQTGEAKVLSVAGYIAKRSDVESYFGRISNERLRWQFPSLHYPGELKSWLLIFHKLKQRSFVIGEDSRPSWRRLSDEHVRIRKVIVFSKKKIVDSLSYKSCSTWQRFTSYLTLFSPLSDLLPFLSLSLLSLSLFLFSLFSSFSRRLSFFKANGVSNLNVSCTLHHRPNSQRAADLRLDISRDLHLPWALGNHFPAEGRKALRIKS